VVRGSSGPAVVVRFGQQRRLGDMGAPPAGRGWIPLAGGQRRGQEEGRQRRQEEGRQRGGGWTSGAVVGGQVAQRQEPLAGPVDEGAVEVRGRGRWGEAGETVSARL